MIDLSPELVLAAWASGLAAAAAVVAWWRIVGVGYLWLAGGVVLLAGLAAAFTEGHPALWSGTALAALASLLSRRPPVATALFAAAAVAYVVVPVRDSGVLLAVSGSVALGGTTAVMLLGHWYLVDPRLPRWALRRLDVAAAAGVLADAAVLIGRGALGWESEDAVIGLAFIAVGAFSVLLLTAVWFALGEPSYAGVMAATGLSYLAVLTVFGASFLGRALLDAGGVAVG